MSRSYRTPFPSDRREPAQVNRNPFLHILSTNPEEYVELGQRYYFTEIKWLNLILYLSQMKKDMWTIVDFQFNLDVQNLNKLQKSLKMLVFRYTLMAYITKYQIKETLIDLPLRIKLMEANDYLNNLLVLEIVHWELFNSLILKIESNPKYFHAMENSSLAAKKKLFVIQNLNNPYNPISDTIISFALFEELSTVPIQILIEKLIGLDQFPDMRTSFRNIVRDVKLNRIFWWDLYQNCHRKACVLKVQLNVLSLIKDEEELFDGLEAQHFLDKAKFTQYLKFKADIIIDGFGIKKMFGVTNPFDFD